MLRLFPLLLLLAAPALAERRLAVVVGANTGWAGDQPLRHARDDAARLAAALVELGDFAPADVTVLEDPTTERLLAALAATEAQARLDPGLFVFFYSGHSDARHLHLQGAPLTLDELYGRLKAHPARVKVGLLDACQSGSVLAAKGGKPAQVFQVKLDDALEVQGTAVLASSGADELSQEARALRGSFFTHHLVSGLRGAADANRDGRVSIPEAYQYASVHTTLDTATSEAGAQRPVFRYELKGHGDVYLTRLTGAGAAVDFAADSGRCFLTDDAERTLVAEVPGGAPARLLVSPGAYVIKCPLPTGYRVAAFTGAPGAAVAVKGLPFRELPLSSGVLKGGGAGPAEDPQGELKRQGFAALRAGQPDSAMELFNQVLAKDLRDGDAYRGKAQAYLALSERAAAFGQFGDAERYRTAAVRTDPRLSDDPEFRRFLPAPLPASPPLTPLVQAEQNLEAAYPYRYQRLGVGLGLFDAHGPLNVSLSLVILEWLQASVHLSPLVLGLGLSARALFRSGNWSPYAGLGGNLTVAGVGLWNGPNLTVRSGDLVLFDRAVFDRLGYLEGGFQAATRHWQFQAGVALGLGGTADGRTLFGVFPSLTLRYFF